VSLTTGAKVLLNQCQAFDWNLWQQDKLVMLYGTICIVLGFEDEFRINGLAAEWKLAVVTEGTHPFKWLKFFVDCCLPL
jgi:hypothetical protein